MLVFLFSCWASLEPTTLPPNFDYTVPEIQSIEWGCLYDESKWTFRITTAGWTGNGNVWMANDDTIEKHRIYSTGAARDGSEDILELELEISADWRDAQPGKSTRWRCRDSSLCRRVILCF